MFENDTFVNVISAPQEYYLPINTQDILPTKKSSLFPLHLVINNPLRPIFLKKSKLKIDRNVVPGYKCFEKRI